MLEAQAKTGVEYAGELSAEVTDAIMQKWSRIGEKIYFSYLILFVSTLKEKLGYKSKGFQYICKLMFCTTNQRMMINDFCICILL